MSDFSHSPGYGKCISGARKSTDGGKSTVRVSGGALHTPGPWRLEGPLFHDGEVPENCTGYRIYAGPEDNEVWLNDVHGQHVGVPLEQTHANARLIAAAPDLLDVVHCLLVAREHETGNTICDENSPLIDAARLAYAKARGEVPA